MIYNGVISESVLCEGHHSLCNAEVSTTYDEKYAVKYRQSIGLYATIFSIKRHDIDHHQF
jgi:hypothetical protein